MNNIKVESPLKYLKSRLGIVNEELKKAYISGKRILVLISDDFELVNELLERASIIPVTKSVCQIIQGTKSYVGYDSIQDVNENSDFITSCIDNLTCCKPTIYISTNGCIHERSLVNFARHFYSLSSSCSKEQQEKIETLRKSIILIVAPEYPLSNPNGESIPASCDSLTEYIKVPYLQENELKGLVSDWLNKNEKIILINHDSGFPRIEDETYLDRMFQTFRALSPKQIEICLNRLKLDYGNIYCKKSPKFDAIIKSARKVSEGVVSKSSALSLKDTSKAEKPDGLQNIVEWLDKNEKILCNPKQHEKYLVRPPKGILLYGIPGTGKSMLAKYIAAKLNLSLVQLDLGDALGRYVGDSEKGFKKALEVAESLSPCVLWIDEMEKMLEGEHEVTRRLIGKFLTWLQEKSDRGISCFVFATANDISKMPPEMFRTGRFDEKFYTFMPCATDCADIFESRIKRENELYAENHQEQSVMKPLFNVKQINRNFFLNILNNHCIQSKISSSNKDLLPRDNKFFIGSDIETLITSAKNLYLEELKTNGDDFEDLVYSDAVFDSKKFEDILIIALKHIRTYGETNLEQIAFAYSQIARNNFCPASSSVIIPIDGYNEFAYKQAYRKDSKTSVQLYSLKEEDSHVYSFENVYDQQLYLVISRAVNSVSLEIIESKKK
jgi:SpoVK/Ycf46/Vps4 family AAA+-type ATPase